MSLLMIVVALIVAGILLWLVNTYLGPYMDAKVVRLINVVVIIVLVLWLLNVFGLWAALSTVRVGPIR